MAMPFVSALPLRLPVAQNDLAGMMGTWMDDSPGLGLSSSNCRIDLEKIDCLRRDISELVRENGPLASNQESSSSSSSSSSSQLELTEKLHEYYHILLECEEHGMVQQQGGSPSCEFLSLEWESSVLTSGPFKLQMADSLESERANLIWNLAALEAHQATKENLKTKPGWNKASKRLQNAASWLGHLLQLLQELEPNRPQTQMQHGPDMSTTFVTFWRALLLAQAQHCIYESLMCVKRPMQLLLAKLAAAAVPLYGEVEMIAQNDENSPEAYLSQCPELVPRWAQFARAWGAYMSCKAQYHQSQIHREKKAWGQEIARLDVAYQHAAVCKNLCEEQQDSSQAQATTAPLPTTILEELRTAVDQTLQLLQTKVETAERENTEMHKQAVPTQQELTEIRGEKLVKSEEPLSKLLRPKTSEPIFQQTSNEEVPPPLPPSTQASVGLPTGNTDFNPVVRDPTMMMIPTGAAPPPQLSSATSSSFMDKKQKASPTIGEMASNRKLENYAEIFKVEMNEIIEELARATEDQTESARLALAEVHLPHSLTAYNQEQSGGGLPNDLWQRVDTVQKDNRILLLKQHLWELKDAADLARSTLDTITSQLNSDKKSDAEFREANPDFKGHDAREVQKSFWERLAMYDTLLSSAQEGDSVLFRRLEQLDIEPKYNLLQFSKSQLDRLLPGARNTTRGDSMVVDTEYLRSLLAELSTLFQERANLMTLFREDFANFEIEGVLRNLVNSTRGTDQDYLEATKHAQKAFEGIKLEIHTNMERQNELLGTIMMENEEFVNSRELTTNSQSAASCIAMIEDAIEDIVELSKHLKDGKDFYNKVNPGLDELKHKVDDFSTRLLAQRLKYEEKERKAIQEEEDKKLAEELNEAPLPSNTENGASASAAEANSDSRPVVDNVASPANTSNAATAAAASTPGAISVDDGNVAQLLEMGFDPDKVVAALEKHNNNMENALTELISC